MLETKGDCGIRSIDYIDSEKIDKTCHLGHDNLKSISSSLTNNQANQNTNPYNNPTSNSNSFRQGFIYGAIAGAVFILIILFITFTKIEYQSQPEKIEKAPIEYDLPEPVYKIYTPGVTRA